MKAKKNMSSADIAIILDEIGENLVDYTVDNIYELEQIYVIRFKGFKPGYPRQPSLLIEPGKRIHLSEYARTFPQHPSPKCLTFRKFLKNGRLTRISQLGFDRVVVIDITNFETKKRYSLYCELFGRGNIILVEHFDSPTPDGQQNRVLFALWYRVMRDRQLLAGKEFFFPPSRGKSILRLTKEDLLAISSQDLDNQIVKVLVNNFGTAGEVVEEILALVDIDKTTPATKIFPSDADKILYGIESFNKHIKIGPPQILSDENTNPVAVVPYPFKSLNFPNRKDFSTFNNACDQYFSPTELLQESSDELEQSNRLSQLQRMLEKQVSHVEELQKTVEITKQEADLLYANIYLVDELFTTILTANKKGMSWEEITNRLNSGKEKKISSATIYQELNPQNKEIVIEIERKIYKLDFTQSPYELVNKFYEQAKKAEKKIEPALQMIEDIKKQIQETEQLKLEAAAITKARAVKKRNKRWYEQYHWTRTLSGKLIIGGRNAKMNEQLAKRRLESKDRFLHADIPGAPYTIVKYNEVHMETSPIEETAIDNLEPLNEPIISQKLKVDSKEVSKNEPNDTEITDDDLREAAMIAGCYSKAWKSGLGSVEVYAVDPTQISFSAPSGEYLPKGSIIISGKRQYFKIPLQLYIGVYFDDTYAYLFVTGHDPTIQKACKVYTKISSSQTDQKKSEIAKKIQNFFERSVNDEENRRKLKTLTINDYILILP